MPKRNTESYIAELLIKVVFFPLLLFMNGVNRYIELVSSNETVFKFHVTVTFVLIIAALIYRFFL